MLRAMSEGPMGRQHPAVDNLDAMRLPTRNTIGAACPAGASRNGAGGTLSR